VRKRSGKPDSKAPHSAAVLSATYDGKLEDGRAVLQGHFKSRCSTTASQAIPLDLANVGIRAATLDGKPAALGRDGSGCVILFVEGKGKHELKLAHLASQTSAPRKRCSSRCNFRGCAADTFRAGNVEVKAGAP